MKLYTYETGDESWDYDMPDGMPPIRNVDNYWVRFGDEVVTKFISEEKAKEFVDRMNKAINNASNAL